MGFWRVSAAAHFTFFVLRVTYVWLDDVVRQDAGTIFSRFTEEFTGSLGSFLLSGLVLAAWQRWPLRRAALWSHVPGYLLLGLALSVANTSFMWATRSLAFPLFGRGAYDYGRMPLRYLMEMPGSLVGFSMIVIGLWFADSITARRQQAVSQANLERALAESQLRSLRLQLQPHFFFNALNTIASQVHGDPDLADRLIGRLSELLRVSYRQTDATLVPLREELALLDAYAELMRVRFGERLGLCVDTGEVSTDVLVPPLLLQPLVENAVRHGRLQREGEAHITVTAWMDGSQITLRVFDDGPGVAPGRDPFGAGTGLSTTAQRIDLLYGERGTLVARNVDGGGFEVVITLPHRAA